MKVNEMAEVIAKQFNDEACVAECDTFKEMKSLYDWDANDIKNEIMYRANAYMNYMYDEGHPTYLVMLDDGSVEDMRTNKYYTYGQFKKMVFAGVR